MSAGPYDGGGDVLDRWEERPNKSRYGPCGVCGAEITATLRANGEWAKHVPCGHGPEANRLLARLKARINGNGAGLHPEEEPAAESAPEPKRPIWPKLDTWRLVVHDRARTEIDKTFRRHGALAAEMLRTEPIETFIATVNKQRNLLNDHFTHDPDGLTSIELEKEVETIAYALKEQYRKADASEQPNDESSGAEVVPPPDPIDLDTPNLDLMPRGIFAPSPGGRHRRAAPPAPGSARCADTDLALPGGDRPQ
jgi:hypothetical protein